MRFAKLKEKSDRPDTPNPPFSFLRFLYNISFWVFLVPFFTRLDYRVGFAAFTAVILIRLVTNLITNNLLDLTPEGYERFPFRIP